MKIPEKVLPERRYKELLKAESKLEALERGGVDNWEWYSEALKDWNRDNRYEEFVADVVEELQQIFAEESEEEYPSVREAGISVSLTQEGVVAMEEYISRMLLEYLEEFHDE